MLASPGPIPVAAIIKDLLVYRFQYPLDCQFDYLIFKTAESQRSSLFTSRFGYIAPAYRSPSLASASFDRLLLRWSVILGYYPFDPGCFAKDLWVILRCSPGYSIVVVKLDAVYDPGESVGTRLYRAFRFACAYYQGIGTFPKSRILGAMGQIQSVHSSPRLTRTSDFNSPDHTTGWLTKPYPGGPMLSHSLSTVNQSQVQTIIIFDPAKPLFFVF